MKYPLDNVLRLLQNQIISVKDVRAMDLKGQIDWGFSMPDNFWADEAPLKDNGLKRWLQYKR